MGMTGFATKEDIEALRTEINDLLDYTERFADLNSEPRDGDCRRAISRAELWLEAGSATLDPLQIKAELRVYVEKFADLNNEPADGDCRRLIQAP